jgi:hypothetical protein
MSTTSLALLSGRYLRNPQTGRLTSVHVHGNRDIPLGALRAIVIEQAGLSPEEFNDLLVDVSRILETWKFPVKVPNFEPPQGFERSEAIENKSAHGEAVEPLCERKSRRLNSLAVQEEGTVICAGCKRGANSAEIVQPNIQAEETCSF